MNLLTRPSKPSECGEYYNEIDAKRTRSRQSLPRIRRNSDHRAKNTPEGNSGRLLRYLRDTAQNDRHDHPQQEREMVETITDHGKIMLHDLTLFGEQNKIEIAIKRIRHFEPPGGYYLAFSGGKDSIVVKKLATLAGVKFDAHYNNTTIDPPELVHYIREFHPDVQEHLPNKSFFQYLQKNGFPLRQRKWCCKKLKEYGGLGRVVLTGIRWQESARRKRRRLYEISKDDKSKSFLHPIIDWDSEEIWEFIRYYSLPYCTLYDEGYARIGCILCPSQSNYQKKRDIQRWPKHYENFRRAFNRLWDKNKNRKAYRHWNSGDEMFNWWISGSGLDKDKLQLTFLISQKQRKIGAQITK